MTAAAWTGLRRRSRSADGCGRLPKEYGPKEGTKNERGRNSAKLLNSRGLTQAEAARLFGFEQRSSRRASGMRNVPYFLVINVTHDGLGTIDADDIQRHR
jgi:hypothetical protein